MKKNKLIIFVIVLGFMLVSLTGCDIFGSKSLSIGSSVKNSDIYVGEVLKLYSNASEIGLTGNEEWTSSDPEVAKIDKDGILEAVGAGEATITLTVGEESVSVDITVLVRSETARITISGPQTVENNGTIKLTATLKNSSSKAGFVWKSSNESIATVDQEGNVRGISGGLCTITASCIDDDTIYGTSLVYVASDLSTSTTIVNAIYEVNGEVDFSALSNDVVNLIKDNIESVVGVSNYTYQNYTSDYHSFEKILKRTAIGTGVIYKKENTSVQGTYKYTVLTNNHVIDGNDAVKIYIQSIEKDIDATVVVTDKNLDLAVVQFEYAIDIKPATLGSIDEVKAGSFVVAIGHPTGYEYFSSATFGIVSYVNRELSGEDSLFIQHDAAINSGNSGGPLFDMNGNVIGINTLKLASDDIDNMGFAVSIQTVREYLGKNNLLP